MHQTTEKDPTQGAPLSAWRAEQEKDSRQGSPLSAWRGRAMEKDWPKRPSDHQLQEALEKTLIGP